MYARFGDHGPRTRNSSLRAAVQDELASPRRRTRVRYKGNNRAFNEVQNEWDPARTDSNDYATYDLILQGIIVPWVRERARRSCQRSCLVPTEIAPRS